MSRAMYMRVRSRTIPTDTPAAQRTESRARAAYMSAVRRALAPNTIVIADGGAGMNIKGYRYELWCAVRELGLRCATVSCI